VGDNACGSVWAVCGLLYLRFIDQQRPDVVCVAQLNSMLYPEDRRDIACYLLDVHRHREFGVNPVVAVGSSGREVDLTDQPGQPLAPQLCRCSRALFGVVVVLSDDSQDAAASVYRCPGGDEAVDHLGEDLSGKFWTRFRSRTGFTVVPVLAIHGLGDAVEIAVEQVAVGINRTTSWRAEPPLNIGELNKLPRDRALIRLPGREPILIRKPLW
jgi:hypothetical protein